jgi:hydroxyacylglutathione hydrolase
VTQITSLLPFGDNYIHLVEQGSCKVVVDPTVAEPFLALGHDLDAILITHHHHDHIGGVAELKAKTGCQVFGPDDFRISDLDFKVGDGDTAQVGPFLFSVVAVPGHTSSHVIYFLKDMPALFCGDFLFHAGCGRVFEGTYQQMFDSIQKLKQFPEETLLYFGHDYSDTNISFAREVESDNPQIEGQPTLSLEYSINPFLRLNSSSIRQTLNLQNASDFEVFKKLRELRNEK